MSLVVPITAALAGAMVYGVTGVLQQRAARRIEGSDQLGLIRGLLAQPSWLLSTMGSLLGFGLQGLALGTGPIVLVQPLLVTGVLFAALTGFLLSRRPVDWPLMASLLLTAAGLAVFLRFAHPTQGSDDVSLSGVLPLAAGLFVLLLGCFVLVVHTRGLARSLALALAAGIVYGVTAAVAKVTIGAFESGGLHAGLTHWSLWGLVVLGPLGFLLNQNAFHEGELVSPPLAVITVTDPLVGIGIGVLWLGESIGAAPGEVVGQVFGLGAMALGVWLVAHRAPHLTASAVPDGQTSALAAGEAGRRAGAS